MDRKDAGEGQTPSTVSQRRKNPVSASSGLQRYSYDITGLPPLARLLADRILDHSVKVGDLLPSEGELCATHGLSRYAVRESMSKLQAIGLISKARGIGTKVISNSIGRQLLYRATTLDDLLAYTRDTVFVITDRRIVTADEDDLIRDLGLTDHKWLRLDGARHLADMSEVVSADSAYIREDLANIPEVGSPLTQSLFTIIEQRHGLRFDAIEQEIRSEVRDAATSRLLGVRPVGALLITIRRLMRQSTTLVVTVARHPAETFSFSTDFTLE